jgi:hypothetical protein
VICAPDYTRTCICDYQNRSSLGLLHDPEAEHWTIGAPPVLGRLAVNFGAPGDRRAPDGTLWWAFPIPVHDRFASFVPVAVEPQGVSSFYHHSSGMKGDAPARWIGPSGLDGARKVRLTLYGLDAAKDLTLRLYFAEMREIGEGKRVFDVACGTQTLVAGLDVFKEVGGRRTLVKEFPGLRASGRDAAGRGVLELVLAPRVGETLLCGLEVVGTPSGAP